MDIKPQLKEETQHLRRPGEKIKEKKWLNTWFTAAVSVTWSPKRRNIVTVLSQKGHSFHMELDSVQQISTADVILSLYLTGEASSSKNTGCYISHNATDLSFCRQRKHHTSNLQSWRIKINMRDEPNDIIISSFSFLFFYYGKSSAQSHGRHHTKAEKYSSWQLNWVNGVSFSKKP